MELIPAVSISSSGLRAERQRLEAAAHNLANANSGPDANGQHFRRYLVHLESVEETGASGTVKLGGVRVAELARDQTPPREVYAPDHPDANERGMVVSATISPMTEMLDMITASRSYEANLTVMRQSRNMAKQTIELMRPGN